MPDMRPHTRQPSVANSSALPAIPGLRSWGAVLVALVLPAIGVTIDGFTSGVPTWGFRLGFVMGVALAAALIRRASIFTAIVQAPLVMAAVLYSALRLMDTERVTITLAKFVNAFPTMLIGTAVAVLICVIRIFAQPLRQRKTAQPLQRTHV